MCKAELTKKRIRLPKRHLLSEQRTEFSSGVSPPYLALKDSRYKTLQTSGSCDCPVRENN